MAMDGNDSTAFLENVTFEQNLDSGSTPNRFHKEYFWIDKAVIPTICAFGIIGNILNLIILMHKQIRSTMDTMEKSAHIGLFSLAISDFCFCLIVFCHAFLPEVHIFLHKTFTLYYIVFSHAFINIFIMTSTWLTVVMATGRYLAICYPLRCRTTIELSWSKWAIVLVYIISVLFNIPWFFQMYIQRVCINDNYIYYPAQGSITLSSAFKDGYRIMWGVICNFVPLIVLVFCNCCLIKALHNSRHMHRALSANPPIKETRQRLTTILVVIVLLFCVLVSPSEIMKFFFKILQTDNLEAYQMIQKIGNILQAINFSINFLLYYSINLPFRQVFKGLMMPCAKKNQKLPVQQNGASFRSNSSMISVKKLPSCSSDTMV
ncbi:unnamed protein product [Owenia fusiformis]|uniref:G-protein coupled receptors family 1 profile domain-containing protein n=1 Tax=Owenia fusiformis TaxID=6347 RepID=A0A8S4NEA3_OWEFU|nr:unnamed protein product [Owenia fusiformis]